MTTGGKRWRRYEISAIASAYLRPRSRASLCAGQEVALVGAGNSAGQAVVYLSSQVTKVWLIVRGPSLHASTYAKPAGQV
jgi:thioredoxin reductase (NADPH)